jgi:sensor c-di-GMP phosphodiesterase-like protein
MRVQGLATPPPPRAFGDGWLASVETRDERDLRLALERDLQRALTEGEFFLVYQPSFVLGDLGLLGFEALLRRRHPRQGVLEPHEFIPALEATRLITDVGRIVCFSSKPAERRPPGRRWPRHRCG